MTTLMMLLQTTKVQTDWSGDSAVLGPVSDWGTQFFTSDSITCQISGQISPVSVGGNPNLWTRHVIDGDSDADSTLPQEMSCQLCC
jgi:hypothetical protein